MSEDIVLRMRRIYCCKGAEFAREELQAGWVEIERLRERIDELEEEAAHPSIAAVEAALNGHFITDEQINAAVEVAGEWASPFRSAVWAVLNKLGIVRCETCPWHQSVPDVYPDCGGHGWKIGGRG